MLRSTCIFFLISLILFSCNNDTGSTSYTESDYECKIRLLKEPGRVHPIYASTSVGREIFQYIFLPMADFHPQTMELYPILIENIPDAKPYTSSDGDSRLKIDITLKSKAQWSDGQPIIAEDFLFTTKAIKHPNSKATAWKPYFEGIKDIIKDPSNPKKFSVVVDDSYP